MYSAILKAYGDGLALMGVREKLPSVPEVEWHKGEMRLPGRVHLDDGFEVQIARADNGIGLMEQVRSYLNECVCRGISFDEPNLVAELQLGIADTAGGSIDLPLAHLTFLTELGMGVSFIS